LEEHRKQGDIMIHTTAYLIRKEIEMKKAACARTLMDHSLFFSKSVGFTNH
jgi:hypothetical protein